MNQREWEQECVRRGSATYYRIQDSKREAGLLPDAANSVVVQGLDRVAAALKEMAERKSTGREAVINKQFRAIAEEMTYEKIAFIALRQVLVDSCSGEITVLSSTLNRCATLVEAELRCLKVHATHPDLMYIVEKTYKDRDIQSYRKRLNEMNTRFKTFDENWNKWDTLFIAQFGSRMVRAVIQVWYDLFFVNKVRRGKRIIRYLDTTVRFEEWVGKFETMRGLTQPTYAPTIEPPLDWIDCIGGYHTPILQRSLPFVKSRRALDRKAILKANPQQHQDAINKLQRTEWEVNTFILETLKAARIAGIDDEFILLEPIPIPEYPKEIEGIPPSDLTEEQIPVRREWAARAKEARRRERKRKSRALRHTRLIRNVEEYASFEKFYFVYTCDFRGRIYCATHDLTPQGDDYAKGLLRFHRGVPLGERGAYWLAVHIANTFGNDKVSREERVAWVKEHQEQFRQMVEDPIAHAQWLEADKPYQFLAACKEWVESDMGTNTQYVSHLPIGLDGSCNGIQHYSALLRDAIGGKATNLTVESKPQDLYAEVAEVTKRLLVQDGSDQAQTLLRLGIDRKTTKRQTMTLPYGSTRTSCNEYSVLWIDEQADRLPKMRIADRWRLGCFLGGMIWQALREVVVAARTAMDWIKQVPIEGHLQWETPIGFPVRQPYSKIPVVQIRTTLFGRVQFAKMRESDDAPPTVQKQRMGVAPNFVHSLDGTHLVMTINACKELEDLAMIHDDFGTHAGNTEYLYNKIREQFHRLYTEYDPLKHWAEQVGVDVDTIPSKGDLDIDEVLKSPYFFT